jgi:hypothetical protein
MRPSDHPALASGKAIARERQKRQKAGEALLAARYMLIEAAACFEDQGVMAGWRTRQASLEREIGGILDSITAGLGNA